ncbi:MAG: hypothetical protein AMXMBFR83_26380 [Phycisphaerae bacterium]
MSRMSRLWRFLEARPAATAVEAEWKTRLGGLFDWARRLLVPTDERATSYPNPDPGGLPLSVVRHRDGSVVAVCTEGTGRRLSLTDADTVIYRLSFRDLRAILAGSLSLRACADDPPDRPAVVPLGWWEPRPACSVPVVLLLADGSEGLRRVVSKAAVGPNGPAILLTPTRRRWSEQAARLASSARAMLVPLDEVVALDDRGAVSATAAWGTYQAAFCGEFLPELAIAPEPPYLFARRGMWVIRFEGRPTYLNGGLRGAAFLQYVLRHPGRDVPVVQMAADLAGAQAANADAAADGLTAHTKSPSLADRRTIAQCKDEYESLQEELEDARRNNDEGRVERLQVQINKIADYLSSVLGLHGRLRREASDAVRLRKRIARVIGIAIEKMAENDAALATHLKNSLAYTGATIRYAPDRPIDWSFS